MTVASVRPVPASVEQASGCRPGRIELLLAGRLPFDRLIRTYPFENINDAAHDMHAGTTIKPVLLMP
jgi:Zn-dependent alcohol dehydrogenase